MTGMSDYSATRFLNYITGQVAEVALPSVWMALMTTPNNDAGTGGTEVSGGAYARVQVAGPATVNGTTASGNPTLHFAATPAWIVAGMTINDVTAPTVIPAATTVLSTTGTTVTMSANATGAGVGATDVITFSAFSASSGSQPSTITNGAAITFAQATLSWGTVVAFELRDAVTTGNLLLWDFLGNFPWLPFESTALASGVGPTFTSKAHGYASNDPIVFTTEYGGTFPTLSVGTMTGYTVSFAGTIATDTFTAFTTSGPTTSFASSTTGSGMVRKIVQQSIPSGVTASFAAAALVASGA